MSNVLAIIAEYNPFHNGHLYQFQKAKKDTDSKYSIAILGGNFTQRGSTSIIDKWSKAQMALDNGFDLVVELPLLYSISSAENFAEGAIKLLDSMKIVDFLSFGTETNNLEILDRIATILYEEPKAFKSLLSIELRKGVSFPKARSNALMMYLKDIKKYANILSSPNNILAIEYLKALKKYKSIIKPYSIQRFEAEYNSNKISGNIASSTAIRNIIKDDNIPLLKKLLPESSFSILFENIKNGHIVSDLSVFEKEIIYNLRKMSITDVKNLPDVSEGLEHLIKKASDSCNSLDELFNIISTKRYTKTRLQRILLYSLIGISKNDMDMSKKVYPYMRVLAFNDKGKFLVSEIAKANPKLEIITSVKRFMDLNTNKNYKTMMQKEILATNIYTLGFEQDSLSNLDYTKKI